MYYLGKKHKLNLLLTFSNRSGGSKKREITGRGLVFTFQNAQFLPILLGLKQRKPFLAFSLHDFCPKLKFRCGGKNARDHETNTRGAKENQSAQAVSSTPDNPTRVSGFALRNNEYTENYTNNPYILILF